MDITSISSLTPLDSSAFKEAQAVDARDTLQAAVDAAGQASDEKKKDLARQFESVFISKLFDQIKESIGSMSMSEEEEGISEQVDGLFWMYLAQDVSEKGGFGMWKDIYKQLQQMDGNESALGQLDKEL
jgi:Rod binding domain-containing protein